MPRTTFSLFSIIDLIRDKAQYHLSSTPHAFKLSKNLDTTKDPRVILARKRWHIRTGRHHTQATPLTRDVLDKLPAQCGDDCRGLRNRVLLPLGY